jgi:hypothetical protein
MSETTDFNKIGKLHARIAQLVEQRIENPRVGGSIPPPGTIQNKTSLEIAGLFCICPKAG